MAAEVFGTEYTVTASAVSLTTVLGLTATTQKFLSVLVLRAGTTNANPVYIGPSTVTTAANRFAFLLPGESLSIDITKSFFSSGQLYVVGTAADKLHIFGVS